MAMPAEREPAPPPRATRAGVSRDTAAILARGQAAAASATALRTRSVHAREVLVELAWPGHDAADLDAWTAGGGPVPADVDVLHLGHYARVLCLQDQLEGDVDRGRRILDAVEHAGRLGEVHSHAVQVLLQLRAQEGDRPGCERLLDHRRIPPDVRAAVRADLANPHLHPGGDSGRWLDLLSTALLTPDLAPLRLDPTLGDTPFDQLTADLPPTQGTAMSGRVDERPLVTVVVSTYRPGPPLLTALRSLVAQTWRHLEILVVDDASPDRDTAEELLRRAEALDPRVRVIRKAVNGGTYRARNTALRQARGRFLTCLDSDDWLHPQAVETLVASLLEDPARMAALSSAARVPEDLRLSRVGYPLRVVGAPTLMVRMDPVVGRLGFFDPTRKSADTEYARRIVAAFGNRSVHRVDDCLLMLRSGQTLSSSEFAPRWRHPARHAYKNVYTPWHEEIRAGRPAYLDPWSAPLVDPLRWRRSRAELLPEAHRYDLVVGGDWRRLGGPQRSMLEEIAAARSAGLRVGVLHLEALRFGTQVDLPLCRPLMDLVRRGDVDQVHLDDPVEVDILQIRYPLVLQHPPHLPSGAFRPRHLLVVANQAPVEPDGTDQRYVVADVRDRARELFGVDPLWVPQSPVIRSVLLAQDPSVRLSAVDSPGVIDVDRWWVADRRPVSATGPTRVGRYSRDDLGKHPRTLTDLLGAYDLGEGWTVRMMGSARTWESLLRTAGKPPGTPPPPGWQILPAGAMEPRELLADLDFFLYHDNPDRFEAFGRVLLEAAASGVVVVTHPRYREVFGDLLDYAEPGESRALMETYRRDPQRYAARVAQMRRLLHERFSHGSYVDRLRTLSADDGRAGVVPGAPVPGRAGRAGAAGAGAGRPGAAGAGARPTGWSGTGTLSIMRTGDHRDPLQVTAHASAGTPLAVHRVRVRSAADAQRSDLACVVHVDPLPAAAADGLARAFAVRAEADLDPALRELVQSRTEGLLALVLVREGEVEVVLAPGTTGLSVEHG